MTRIKRPKRFHTLSGGKPQVKVLKTTPILMINKKGEMPFFMSVVFADG